MERGREGEGRERDSGGWATGLQDRVYPIL